MSDEFEKLDSPLIVHKETDASYHETANINVISTTNKTEENESNLVRHRFRKKKKKHKAPYFILLLVIIIAVLCGLYFSGVIGNKEENNTTEKPTNKTYAEVPENRYEGVITVKGTYIFFEGDEVDGTADLERILKYLDTDTTFVIQDEDAEPVLLSQEIIPLLDKYEIKHGDPKYIISSGLHSKYEKTEASSENTSTKN